MSTVEGGGRLITDGLVLYLDASNLDSYPGPSSTWLDLTKNNYNGSLVGTPTFSNSNRGGLVFNGSTQYVNMGTSGLPLIRNTTTITLCAAFYCTGFSNLQSGFAWSPIFAIDSYNSGNSYRKFVLQASSNNGVQGISSYFTNGAGVEVGGALNTTVLNNFFYVVATVDSNSNRLYVNGNLVSQGAGVSLNTNPQTADFTVGARINTAYNGFFIGTIYLTQIYNRALTADEVLKNFNIVKTRFN